MRFSPFDWLHAEAYWGGQLNDVVKQSNDLQEDGFHFRVSVVAF